MFLLYKNSPYEIIMTTTTPMYMENTSLIVIHMHPPPEELFIHLSQQNIWFTFPIQFPAKWCTEKHVFNKYSSTEWWKSDIPPIAVS